VKLGAPQALHEVIVPVAELRIFYSVAFLDYFDSHFDSKTESQSRIHSYSVIGQPHDNVGLFCDEVVVRLPRIH